MNYIIKMKHKDKYEYGYCYSCIKCNTQCDPHHFCKAY